MKIIVIGKLKMKRNKEKRIVELEEKSDELKEKKSMMFKEVGG